MWRLLDVQTVYVLKVWMRKYFLKNLLKKVNYIAKKLLVVPDTLKTNFQGNKVVLGTLQYTLFVCMQEWNILLPRKC